MCHKNEIQIERLPPNTIENASAQNGIQNGKKSEKTIIQEALIRNRGNRNRVAKELDMRRSTHWRKIKS